MNTSSIHRLTVVDSHTGGEPTRVVISGGPDLGDGPLAVRVERFRAASDHYRSAIVNEPRGSDVVVGALLVEPHDTTCEAGVIFFNNVGYLGMCGHGTIGLISTLAHLGRLRQGDHRIETPVGVVTTTLHENGDVSVTNVPSYRQAAGVTVEIPDHGSVQGDVAWGGNWFFLVERHGMSLTLADVPQLTEYCGRIRQAVNAAGYAEVDHIELFGPPEVPARTRETSSSVRAERMIARHAARGPARSWPAWRRMENWRRGSSWVQESIIGSTFTGRYCWEGDRVVPTITGSAFVCAESTLLINKRDRFAWGIRQ